MTPLLFRKFKLNLNFLFFTASINPKFFLGHILYIYFFSGSIDLLNFSKIPNRPNDRVPEIVYNYFLQTGPSDLAQTLPNLFPRRFIAKYTDRSPLGSFLGKFRRLDYIEIMFPLRPS